METAPTGSEVQIVATPMETETVPTGSEVQIVATPMETETVPTGSEVQIVATPMETETAPTGSEVQMVATPMETETAPTGSEVQIVATPIQPAEPTDAQKRFEKWKVKWMAVQAEKTRLHELKPAQERFQYAVEYGQFDKVQAFLTSGHVDVNGTRGQFYSPLAQAAMGGHVKVLQMILEHGGDVHFVSQNGHTALHSALLTVQHKRVETIVRELLLHGSDVNKGGLFGRTPIQHAVVNGSSAMVQILLDHGADTSKRDDRGHNALHALAHRSPRSVVVQNKICKMLINHGSDIKFKLRVLQAYDYGFIDTEASDSEDEEVPPVTPVELADLMGKTHIAAMMKEKEQICIRQTKQLFKAKYAKIEARRRLVKTAFAMGQHARLGADSRIMGLSPDMLQMILKHV
jgi:uncharacterized protein